MTDYCDLYVFMLNIIKGHSFILVFKYLKDNYIIANMETKRMLNIIRYYFTVR